MKDKYDLLLDWAKDRIESRVKMCIVDVSVYDPTKDSLPNHARGRPFKVKLTPVLNDEVKPEYSAMFVLDIEVLYLADDREEFIDYYLSKCAHGIAQSMFLEPTNISYSF